jgi:hypothetical protein
MSETRRRLALAGIAWTELATAWDVDTPADLDRLARDAACAPLLDGLVYARPTRREPDRQAL